MEDKHEKYFILAAQGDFASGDALAVIACYEIEDGSSFEYYLRVLNGIEPLSKDLICNTHSSIVTREEQYNEAFRLCKSHLDFHMVRLWNKYKSARYHDHRYILDQITLDDLKRMHLFGTTGDMLTTITSNTHCQSLKNDCEKVLAIKQALKGNLGNA